MFNVFNDIFDIISSIWNRIKTIWKFKFTIAGWRFYFEFIVFILLPYIFKRAIERSNLSLTLFRMGFFGAAHGWGGGGAFCPPLLKIRHTYSTVMKLGTVIPYLRKIQKMHKSRDTSLQFCWHQQFFNGSQQILLHQQIDLQIGF